jgi:transcriptional regulator with XRE-family HTH domain
MRLADWRKEQGYTQQQLADQLGVNQSAVSYWERSLNPYLPQPDAMRRIFALTRGAVSPNDFYDLPPIGQAELPDLAPDDSAPLLAEAGLGQQ